MESTENAVDNKSSATFPFMPYWDMMKGLDNSARLELISMLADSMNPSALELGKKLNACDYAGVWNDEEYVDADELVKVIRDARHCVSNRDHPSMTCMQRKKARLTLEGTPTAEFDLLIGCTAVSADMVLVTQNIKDFQNIKGVLLENWISDAK